MLDFNIALPGDFAVSVTFYDHKLYMSYCIDTDKVSHIIDIERVDSVVLVSASSSAPLSYQITASYGPWDAYEDPVEKVTQLDNLQFGEDWLTNECGMNPELANGFLSIQSMLIAVLQSADETYSNVSLLVGGVQYTDRPTEVVKLLTEIKTQLTSAANPA